MIKHKNQFINQSNNQSIKNVSTYKTIYQSTFSQSIFQSMNYSIINYHQKFINLSKKPDIVNCTYFQANKSNIYIFLL